jgi:hypothetical protein
MSRKIILSGKRFLVVNILAFYLLCFLFISVKLYSQNISVLKIETEIKPVNYYDIFEISRYVKLETNQKSLVSQIYSVKFRNDTVFAFSRKKVYLWTFSGKFIRSIGTIGHGSSEMFLPSDFAISPKGNKIGIWDNILCRLFIYDINGKFLEKVNPGLKEITNFDWTNSNQLVFYSQYVPQNNKHFSLYLSDPQGNIVNFFLPYDPNNDYIGFINYNYFPRSNKIQYVWTDFNQTVYEIKGNSIIPSIRYEFDKRNLNSKEIVPFKGDTRKLVDYIKDKGYWLLFSFNNLDNYYSLTYTNTETRCTNIILRNGKQYRIQHSAETLDPMSEFMPIFTYNNELVCIVEPYILKTKLKQTLPQMKQRMGAVGVLLDKLSRELKVDDNPVLLFLKLKKS